jgi:hypothetical protein
VIVSASPAFSCFSIKWGNILRRIEDFKKSLKKDEMSLKQGDVFCGKS